MFKKYTADVMVKVLVYPFPGALGHLLLRHGGLVYQ